MNHPAQMSTPKTAPDFGEPWQAIGNHLYDRFGHQLAIFNYGSHAERAAISVIACSGLSDPAAEIQALREAVKEARDALEWAIKNMNPPFEWEPFTKANATLSKLQSIA